MSLLIATWKNLIGSVGGKVTVVTGIPANAITDPLNGDAITDPLNGNYITES